MIPALNNEPPAVRDTVSSHMSRKNNSVLITPRKIEKRVAPTELRIRVKTLQFTNKPQAADSINERIHGGAAEADKYFVLISFNGENFVTAKKKADIATNSINFEQLSDKQNEIVVNLTIAGNREKTIRFGVNVVSTGKDKRSKLFGRVAPVKIADLKVSSAVGSQKRIVPVEKIDLERSKSLETLGSQPTIDQGEKIIVGQLEITFISTPFVD